MTQTSSKRLFSVCRPRSRKLTWKDMYYVCLIQCALPVATKFSHVLFVLPIQQLLIARVPLLITATAVAHNVASLIGGIMAGSNVAGAWQFGIGRVRQVKPTRFVQLQAIKAFIKCEILQWCILYPFSERPTSPCVEVTVPRKLFCLQHNPTLCSAL